MTGDDPEIIRHDDPDANAKISDSVGAHHAGYALSVRSAREWTSNAFALKSSPTVLLLSYCSARSSVASFAWMTRKDLATQQSISQSFLSSLSGLAAFQRTRKLAYAIVMSQSRVRMANARTSRLPPSALRMKTADLSLISGKVIAQHEINAAERLIRNDPQLFGLSLQQGLRLLRKIGFRPDPEEMPSDPLHVQKKRIRDDIVRTVKAVAIRRNSDNPDFSGVQVALNRKMGVRNIDDLMDNRSIEVMRQALHILRIWLAGKDETA